MRENKVESLMGQGRWEDARKLIQRELKATPRSHWLLTRLGTTHYEERSYQEALRWAERALQLAPACPLVLWDYAGTLDALGRHGDALWVYRRLIDLGAEKVGSEECGEGFGWAVSLLADCVFRAAGCLEKLGRQEDALRHYRRHLAYRDAGVASIYPRSDAERLAAGIALRQVP